MIGFNGKISISTDEGMSWVLMDPIPGVTNLKSLYFRSSFHGIVANEEAVYKTTNSGLNWNTFILPERLGNGCSMDFNEGDIGFLVGGKNLIYFSKNNGFNWIKDLNYFNLQQMNHITVSVKILI